MKLNDAFPGNYLKKEDFEPERTMTIKGCSLYEFKDDDKKKPGITFEEDDRPLIMNKTNWGLISTYLGSDDTDDWIGKQVTLYNDPSISMGGKLVGGVRVKPAEQQAKAEF